MAIAIIAVIAIIIIAAIVLKSSKRKKDGEGVHSEPEKKIVLEKTTSTIYVSDEFKSKESVIKIEKNHTIKTIYANEEDSFVWVCPNCEVENPLSKNRCCVCNYKR